LPEHVSFYNRRSLDTLGRLVGLEGVDYRELCHKRLPLSRWIGDTLKSLIYFVGNRANGFGIPALRRAFVGRRGPTIQSAQDHLIYVYRKAQRAPTASRSSETLTAHRPGGGH
jgi:hypothetical protein